MNEKLKEAFRQVQADEALKERTKDFIFQKTEGYTKQRKRKGKHAVPALACLVTLFIVGYWLYFIPTLEISIDINPSIELGINRFNRVISVEGRNDDGEKIIETLDIKFMDYTKAFQQIMEEKEIASLLSNDEVMTVAVIGEEGKQSSQVLSHMQSCTKKRENTHCYYAHTEEVEKAHDMGISYGKYRAFLEIQEINPDITLEEIKDMTMKEIKELIGERSEEENREKEDETHGKSHGSGKAHGHERRH